MNQMTPSRNSYLAHYGVKGMKWGVRNGPPYPLGVVQSASNLSKLMDSFDYGVSLNGKKLISDDALGSMDWSKYRTTPVSELEKTKTGVCWDFTNYQHHALKKAGIPHDTNLLVMDRGNGDIVTHTYTTLYDEKGNCYWLESALWPKRGLHKVKDAKTVAKEVAAHYDPSGKRAYDLYRFDSEGMDQGLTDQEFFNRATSSDPIYQRRGSNAVAHSGLHLAHYGVKGMKWGVRRYRDNNGKLTEAGKKQAYLNRKTRDAMKTTDAANAIVETLSSRDKALLGAEENEAWVPKEHERETSMNIAKRVVESSPVMKEPAAFFEIWDNGGDVGEIAIASRSEAEFRGKGYAYSAAKKGKAWFDKYGYKRMKRLDWIVDETNAPSIGMAKKLGFEEDKFETTHPEWNAKQTKGYKIYTYKKN